MALETTLMIDGVTAPGAPIRVLAWSFGASNSVSFNTGGGGAGKANFQDLSVTKPVDETSLRLLRTLATGDNFQRVELVVSDTSSRGSVVLRYILAPVLVTSVSQGGSTDLSTGGPKVDTEQLLTENVTLAFGSIEGEGPGGTSFGWNVTGNSGT